MNDKEFEYRVKTTIFKSLTGKMGYSQNEWEYFKKKFGTDILFSEAIRLTREAMEQEPDYCGKNGIACRECDPEYWKNNDELKAENHALKAEKDHMEKWATKQGKMINSQAQKINELKEGIGKVADRLKHQGEILQHLAESKNPHLNAKQTGEWCISEAKQLRQLLNSQNPPKTIITEGAIKENDNKVKP